LTIEEVVESLKAEIKTQLNFPAFLLPQKAGNNTAHIDLLYQDMDPNGDGNEKLSFLAEYRTAGTHTKWLTQTVKLRRKLNEVENTFMPFEADGIKLHAYWIRNGKAQWVYPSEEESSMPAEYVIPYRIEIDIPTRLITEE
jgi:hypothetical protein